MMEKERLKSIDYLKGIAIMLVVLGHTIQMMKGSDAAYHDRLFNYIYSFHMPVFMFVSGYVSYKACVSMNDIKKRAYQLLLPFFFFPLASSLCFKGQFNTSTYYHLIERPDSGLWFFYVLFIISTLFTVCQFGHQLLSGGRNNDVIDKFNPQLITKLLLIVGLFMFALFSVFALWLRKDSSNDYGTALLARHSIFYMSDLITKIYSDKIIVFLKRNWLWLILLWLIMATFWELEHKPTFIQTPNLAVEMGYYYLTAFAGILMMMAVCIRFVKQEGSGNVVVMMASIGKMTLGIYAIHLSFLLRLVYEGVKHVGWDYKISMPLVFVVTTIGSTILTKIIERGNIASQLLLGKVNFNCKK